MRWIIGSFINNKTSKMDPSDQQASSSPPPHLELRDPKLLKIHLRYHPPGIILEYLDAYRVIKETTIDLFELNAGTNIPQLMTELLNAEPLFCTHTHRLKCMDALEKLQQTQFHDFSKRYLQFQIIKPHSLPLTGAAFSKDGLKVATSCLGNACKVWNAQSGREITTLVGHEDAVTSINFNKTGDQILTSSHDGTLRHWRLGEDMLISCKHVLKTATSISGRKKDNNTNNVKNTNYDDEGQGSKVLFCKYSPDNQAALSATDDKKACVHDLVQGVLSYKFCPILKESQDLNSINMDKTGTLLLVSPHDTKTAALFDLRSGELTDTLDSHAMEVTKSIFNFSCENIATSSWDGTVKLWDVRMLEEPVHTFCESESEILDIEFDPCGKSIVAGSADGNIFVWNTTKGKFLFEKEVQKSPLSRVMFSPNGAVVLGCNDHGTICMYHGEMGSCLQTLPDHTREIVGVAFSYDSKYLMTASKDKTVRIHKLTTHQ